MTEFIVPAMFISPREISQKADLEFRRYAAMNDSVYELGMSFDSLYEEYIYPTYEIELKYADLGHDDQKLKIYGSYVAEDNTAYIDESLASDPRRVFTAFHEVCGHGMLQGSWIRSQLRQIASENDGALPAVLSYADELERQANSFASHLAAPTALINRFARTKLRLNRPIEFRGPGVYGVQTVTGYRQFNCDSFQALSELIARPLQRYFGHLSVQALAIRVTQCSLVVDLEPKSFVSRGIHRVGRSDAFTSSSNRFWP